MAAIHVAALFGQTEVVQEFLSRTPKSALLVSEVREGLCPSCTNLSVKEMLVLWFNVILGSNVYFPLLYTSYTHINIYETKGK